jgi:hypothetical protein
MPGSKDDTQGEEEAIYVERLVLGLRATAKAEAEVVVPPLEIAPLSAAERDDIVAAILSAPTASRTTREISGVTSLAAERRRRSRWVAIAAPLAVAAGLALVLGLPARNPAFPPLPAYDVSALGGLKEVRGGVTAAPGATATAPTERVARDTDLTIRLRPATAVDGPLAVRAFLAAEGGAPAQELSASVDLAPSGAAEIHVRPGASAPAGRATVRVLVGRPDDVRAATPADATGAPADASGRRWLTVPVDVQ